MALSVPTPTGVLDGIALFNWDGAAWQPSGRAMPSVATPTGVLRGSAGFTWSGTAWAPTGVPVPDVATPSGVLDGVALFTWNGTAWTPVGGATSVPTPTGVLRGVAAFAWDGSNWQPAGQAAPDVATPYGVLRGVAPYNWIGTAWAPGSVVPADLVVSTAGPVSVTGTTAETNLASLRIPANSIGKNGAVEIKALWSYTNSANAKNFTHKLSASAGITGSFITSNAAPTTTASAQSFVIFRNNNATNSQTSYVASPLNPYGSGTNAVTINTFDTTQDVYVNLTGFLALATETLTLQRATAVVFYAP